MSAPVLEIPRQLNAASHFVDANVAAGRGNRPALYCGDRVLTYADVQALVNRVGNGLRRLGVLPEQRVLLVTLDCPEMVAAFFGAIKIGAVAVPVNTLMRPADYAYFLQDTRAPVAIVSEALLPQVAAVRDQSRYLKHLIVIGSHRQDAGEALPGVLSFDAWMAGESGQLEAEEMTCDDAAYWLYSSGTTGFPKGAVHLQHDMIVSAELYAKPVLGITERDVCFSVAKLFHAYGLGNALYFPFAVGASAVLFPGRPTPEVVYGAISRYRPTLFFGVPTGYAQMLAVPEAQTRQYDLSSLRLCVSAAEPLPGPIFERWKARFGVEILDGIGSTEINHIFLTNFAGRVKPGSSGTPVPGYELRVVDEEERDVPQGEIGNLLVKGDSTCAYYWNQHQKTKQTIIGEWIRTGDKYWVDEDGYYWYAGRSDDMLKVGGRWVSPAEVESALIEHEAVLESGVVGRADADGLIKPHAFVILKPGREGTPELAAELQEFVKQRIAPYKYPRWVEFVSDMPKTATGKIQRFRLRELVAER